jgi:site-specific DNA recombinase
LKAAVYSRFSTDRQTESSIEDQVRVCSEHAQREGWTVAEKFSDKGISGAAVGNRPGVRRMLDAALARRFDVLLVNDLSRLSRSNGDLSKMIDRLVAKGVRVVGAQDGYDSARRGHKLQAGLSGIIGEAFRDMIRDRVHAALESRAKDGRPTGGKCYGYRNNGIHEPEAEVVRDVFKRFIAGGSYRSIATGLNAERVPSPGSSWKRTERRCSGWMTSAVRSILINVRYTGLIRWNTSEWRKDPDTGKRLRHERPRSDWQEHHDEALRVVSDATWRKAQTRLTASQERSGGQLGRPRRYLLSGMLVCACCDAHFVMVNRERYGCSSRANGSAHACSNDLLVARNVVEPIVLRTVKMELLSDEALAEMRAYVADAQRGKRSHRSVTAGDVQAVEKQIDKVTDAIATVGLSKALRTKLLALEQQRDALEGALRALDAEPVDLAPRMLNGWRKLVGNMEDLARHPDARPADVEEARERLAALIGKVRMIPQGRQLVAEVGLHGLVGIGDPRERVETWADPEFISLVAGVGFEPTTFGL